MIGRVSVDSKFRALKIVLIKKMRRHTGEYIHQNRYVLQMLNVSCHLNSRLYKQFNLHLNIFFTLFIFNYLFWFGIKVSV